MQAKKYEYASLSDLIENRDNNFYGIIYDASYPTVDEKTLPGSGIGQNCQIQYECTVKLIDQGINPITNKDNLNDNIINVVIKSNSRDRIPYIHAIGDIMRVHRGIYSKKKKKNVYINLNYTKGVMAAWTIFPGASVINKDGEIVVEKNKLYEPKLCSSSHYNFESQDEKLIDDLRNFMMDLFSKSEGIFYPFSQTLDKRNPTKSDNDSLVQVIYKRELEDQIVYFVQDKTDGCELHTYKYYNFIDVNDVIRIRSFKILSPSNSNVLVLNKFSNILKIPLFTAYHKDFVKGISDKILGTEKKTSKNPKGNNLFALDNIKFVPNPKNILINLSENPNNIEVKNFEALKGNDQVFILRANILQIIPEEAPNWIYVYCPCCKRQFKESEVHSKLNPTNYELSCPHCSNKSIAKLYFNVNLICIENSHTSKMIDLHLCSYDGEGDDFFGSSAYDVINTSNGFQLIQEKVKKLMNKDVYVQVMIQKILNGFDNEKKTLFRIIGHYKSSI
ncbi:MAG: hypothetical protein MJ252_29320 [archaeon]|nr:hypothetical protein [archaeon]